MSQGNFKSAGTCRISMPRTLRSVQAVLALAGARDLRELRLAVTVFVEATSPTSIIGVGCRTESGSAGGVLIIGMGVDIAEVERIQGAIERHGEVFVRRIYTSKKREYCEQSKNKYARYERRLAAIETPMKARGAGWRSGV